MILNFNMFQRRLGAAVVAVLVAGAIPAVAKHGRGGGHGWDDDWFHGSSHHSHFGRVFHFDDLLGAAILFAGIEYFFHSGYYYRRVPEGYVLVDPPVGLAVTDVPAECKRVRVDDRDYYVANEVYYVKKRDRYVVVEDPVVASVQPLPREAGDAYTVYVPKAGGGYGPVVVKKAGDGFLGPQGEYYPDFPTVHQLEVMYGK